MTEVTLTREQIEEIAQHGAVYCSHKKLKALCALALRGLDVKPRPLRDIEGDGPVIVVERHNGETYGVVLRKYEKGWRTSEVGMSWIKDSLATPLSAFTKEPT